LNIRATALIGVPSQSAAKTKACFSLKNQIRVNKKRYILFKWQRNREEVNAKALAESQRARRHTVTLTKVNEERAKKQESNFSGLLDRLLSDWIA
jgi:hypothetical protein